MKFPQLSSWERIKDSGLPAVIYGMGNGADRVLDEFIRLGIPVMGISASDAFVRGQSFRGYKVKRLSDFKGEFILAPAFGSSIPEVMNHLVELSLRYNMIYPVVPVFGNEIFNRDFVTRNVDRIEKAESLFSGRSLKVYENCIRFIYGGDINDLLSADSGKDEIYESLLQLTDDEVYLDLGAYKGDTVTEFLTYTSGRYGKIIAVEPDRRNYIKLEDNLSDLKNCVTVNKAVGNKSGNVLFSDDAGRQSAVSDKGKPVECITVDELCRDIDVSYIKADVEGSEALMIEGARNTISRCRPKLNIALYHRSSDIFEIPLKIYDINPEYSFEIRKHPYIPCWDMNLYCK